MERIAKVEPLTSTRKLRGPFDYRVEGEWSEVEVGALLLVPFGHRELLGIVTAITDSTDLSPEKVASPIKQLEFGLTPEQIELAQWISDQYCSTFARALSLVLPPGVGLGSKPRKRLRTKVRNAEQKQYVSVGASADTAHELNEDQRDVLSKLLGALRKREAKRFLLNGVTGSGKTEIYLQAVDATLAEGHGAIILVPEIALTPQTVGRFQRRFGDQIAVLHSQMTVGERYDQWLRLKTGEARICIGPRSALFAPIDSLGLVVIDEEHDSSYKNESDPKYDARHVAEKLSELTSAVLVTGSATPRAESFANYEQLALPTRADGSQLPPVEVVDMRGTNSVIHRKTGDALADVRARGEKAIVLLNRRGWSNFLTCRTCGHVWGCPNCEVTLVIHQGDGELVCHHCGWREQMPISCDQCGSVSLARHGAGTERLEEELTRVLADRDFPIFRLDSDVAGGRERIESVLQAFDSAPAGVLLGTQMVAKGHDFPEVTLAVVLDADRTLRFPDFRAQERTFQLVAQLAGRAGRGEKGGRVLVQTITPDEPAIRFAARHDTEGFMAAELEHREALDYPPSSDLIRIVCSSSETGVAQQAAVELLELIAVGDESVLGPAPLFRLRGRERSQIVIKTHQRAETVAAVRSAVDAFSLTRRSGDFAVSIDVDPQ